MSTSEVGICAFPINKIATHVNPHVDEIAGIWMLRKFGSKHFPGIEKAPVEYWGNGTSSMPQTPEEYLNEGILLVGIGGGMFDEHSTVEGERKEDKCAATLIADYLGISDNPELEKILEFVQKNDLKGTGTMFDIASVSRRMYQFVASAEQVMKWVVVALETMYLDQLQFVQNAAKEYAKASVHTVRNSDGGEHKVVVIESDDPLVAKFAFSTGGGKMSVVVQRRSTGNVQIFSNKRQKPDMDKIARFIRVAAQKANGTTKTLKPEDLIREGSVAGAEEWYYFRTKGTCGLFNGNTSHPDVPPTTLPLEEIVRIVCNCVF